jgi:UDP-N-acetylglucosamine 4,6-dehydratase/5-epimerase
MIFEATLSEWDQRRANGMNMTLEGCALLVTGGTGSFGRAFVADALRRWPGLRRLVVFSRDELKQSEMARCYPEAQYPQLRFFIGDVRDRDRLRRALEGIDVVVHAAALKQVPAAEYNPMEFIKTNIIGAENLVEACMDTGVRKVIALSTDKASAPVNLYGATKLCSDKLFVAANNFRGPRDLRFSVVRYGNVLGSRGSVIPFFLEQAKTGVLQITDREMTRFSIALPDCIEMVAWVIGNALGGEIFVVKCPSYRIVDVATAIGPSCRHEVIGVRPGEKLHEDMVSAGDSLYTLDLGSCYAIVPSGSTVEKERYVSTWAAQPVPSDFTYNSGRNPLFLSIEAIRELIVRYVEPSFKPL